MRLPLGPSRSLPETSRLRRAGMQAVTVLAVAACGPSASGSLEPDVGSPVVTEQVMTRALSSERPARLTMTDEIEFFRDRLAHGGEAALPRKRLLTAHLSRFRIWESGRS